MQTKFKYLGQTYKTDNINLPPRRLLCASLPQDTQSARKYYFTIASTDHNYTATVSTSKVYWKRYATVKHFQRMNLTKQEATYLKNLPAHDFREHIKLALHELKTIYEIS